jgi:hypothetical protein
VLGRPVSFHLLTFEEERQATINAGVPEPVAEMNAQALSMFAQGDSDWVTAVGQEMRSGGGALIGRPAAQA